MPNWLTIKQAAAYIEMSYGFVYNAIHEPDETQRLKAARFGSVYRILESDLDDYIVRARKRTRESISAPSNPTGKRTYRKRKKPVTMGGQPLKYDINNFRVQDLAKQI